MDFNDLKGMFGEVKTRMDGAIDRVRKEMASVRTGRATVSLLDSVQVDAYGSRMPINQVATLSVPEPVLRLIVLPPTKPMVFTGVLLTTTVLPPEPALIVIGSFMSYAR